MGCLCSRNRKKLGDEEKNNVNINNDDEDDKSYNKNNNNTNNNNSSNNDKRHNHSNSNSSNGTNGSNGSSSIHKRMSIQFEYIDGRRYQTSMPYFAPVDEAEIVRQDLEDTMLRLWWGNSFGSPVAERLNGEGTKVLDVGCGAGYWMCDLATRYPKTLFVGLDISPMFPRDNPTNAAFLELNILEKMPFPDNTFDFVHQRMLSGGITQKQWENHIVMELVRITKPNGYVEFVEADSTFYSSGKVTRRISNALKRHIESKGQCGFIGTHIKGILENTQQVTNITHDVKDIVLGNRAGKSGEMALQNIVEMLKSIRPALSKSMEITNNHFDALVETFMRETNVYETIWRVHRVYACKIDAPV